MIAQSCLEFFLNSFFFICEQALPNAISPLIASEESQGWLIYKLLVLLVRLRDYRQKSFLPTKQFTLTQKTDEKLERHTFQTFQLFKIILPDHISDQAGHTSDFHRLLSSFEVLWGASNCNNKAITLVVPWQFLPRKNGVSAYAN